MRPRFSVRRTPARVLLAGVLLAVAVVAAAAGSPATASRAEIERWFGTLRAQSSLDVTAPQRWVYSFVAADGRALEALSVALVRDGYQIVMLEGRSTPTLRMSKTELHSPLALARRNQVLQQIARKYNARYLGVDVIRSD